MTIYIFFSVIVIVCSEITTGQQPSKEEPPNFNQAYEEILSLTNTNFNHFYDPKLFRISSQTYDAQKDLECKLKEGLYRKVKILQSLITYHCVKDNFCIHANNQQNYQAFEAGQSSVSQCLFSYTYDDQKESQCRTLKGQYKRQGRAGFYSCLKIYKDGDKPCQKSSECQSFCIIRSSKDSRGRCKKNNSLFGCWGVIEKGGIRCSD